MYARLKNNTPLPPSQVVRTTPRGTATISATTNVPPIATAPATTDQITFSGTTVNVPE
jgi:hydroxybutyrate-dimer hydrolase